MSAILKIKIPFFRKKTSGASNGIATFYLGEIPKYLPTLNQVCLITHTNVPVGSGLANKLKAMSTNVVTGKFQSYEELANNETIEITDNYKSFFVIEYDDHTFSINQFSGDSTGYIEYDVNPATYQILKPVENVAIVNENVPYDLDEGYSQLYCLSGTTETAFDPAPVMPGLFVRLQDNNTIFANLLKSLNLPVSEEEMRKYTRSELGTLSETTAPTGILIDGKKYNWSKIGAHTTGVNLTTHPVTGYTGEYYNTVLQTIGSIDYKLNNSKVPIKNQVALIFEIPQAFYGEIIDGKTIKLTLPYWAASTMDSNGQFTYTGSEIELEIYGTYNKNGVNLDRNFSEKDLSLASLGARPDLEKPIKDYESNVVLLFANIIKKPQGDATKDWSAGHVEVIDGVKVFDRLSSNPKDTYDHNLDVCVGAAYLDKGFIAITHPQIVDSIFTNAFDGDISLIGGVKSYDFNSPAVGVTKGLVKTNNELIKTVNSLSEVEWDNTQWVFNGISTEAKIEYISYNSEKSLNIVCLASADEFYRSTNPTAKELIGVAEGEDFTSFKSDDSNLYPVIITQIGIHDAQGNLLGVCKPPQPVKKYWFDVATFNIKIRL